MISLKSSYLNHEKSVYAKYLFIFIRRVLLSRRMDRIHGLHIYMNTHMYLHHSEFGLYLTFCYIVLVVASAHCIHCEMLAISRHRKALQAPVSQPHSDTEDYSSSSDESQPGDSGQESPELTGAGTQTNDSSNIYYLKPKPYNLGEGGCQLQ